MILGDFPRLEANVVHFFGKQGNGLSCGLKLSFGDPETTQDIGPVIGPALVFCFSGNSGESNITFQEDKHFSGMHYSLFIKWWLHAVLSPGY